MTVTNKNITALLQDWSEGTREVFEELLPLVYDDLHRQAARRLRRERPNHTLQTSALVNETFIKLVEQKRIDWKNRNHFFAVAATLMRRVLVDYAREHDSLKRGGGNLKISFTDAAKHLTVEYDDVEIIALDKALTKLAALDERQNQIVELMFFSGLTVDETAEVLGVSDSTVKREWRSAKAWLRREIKG